MVKRGMKVGIELVMNFIYICMYMYTFIEIRKDQCTLTRSNRKLQKQKYGHAYMKL